MKKFFNFMENPRPRQLRAMARRMAFYLLTVCLFMAVGSEPLHAAYVKRYTTIANGGMTYTGNTLGLSKATNSNQPGTNGAIGAFITPASRWAISPREPH